MAYQKILLTCKDGVGQLTLNDPNALNAVSAQMVGELIQAFDEIEARSEEFRCVVMTGAGRGFCAGANLQERPDRSNEGNKTPKLPDAGAGLEVGYHPLLRRMRNLHCPFVTAINGPAAGVGFSFALMGDMILAAKSAYFLQAFRRIGLVPDGGSTWLLPRLVGMARARELTLMGNKLPAETAHEWGLVNRVVEDADLMAEAEKMAQELARGPASLRHIRDLIWASPDNSYEEQLNMERDLQRLASRTKDFREGVDAFVNKRPAKFQGK
ncbi:MAG: enoyl-CoA hydratase/isomerase [Hyphomicrobiales bacterium]|nr:enoyl-CoA hydratase/isomerase [Hyphomicrobiales bacterium]